MFRAAAIAVLLLLASVAGFAQKFGEAVQVSVVEVPVTVVDRNGNAVRGLTKENFELYDEGRRVPIEYFDSVDLTAIAASPGPTPRRLPPVAMRNFLLLFDLENSPPGTVARAQNAAVHFIGSGLGERDLIAVATFSAQRGVQILTSFTADRALARTAVRNLGQHQFRSTDSLMLSTDLPDAPPLRGETAQAGARPEGKRIVEAESRNHVRIQLSNFARLARILNGLHGQKQIILLSEGFDARLLQGRTPTGAQARREMEQVFRGEGYNLDTDERFGNVPLERALRDMGTIFRGADVTLHAIDIAGLRTVDRRSPDSLSLVTTPTGGTVYKNANDLRDSFQRILRQQEVVYLLGFRAESTGSAGKYHNLRVKTVNTNDARVSHRSGYFETSPDTKDIEKALTLAEIVMNDLPIEDVVLSISATAIPGPGTKARVPVMIQIPGRRLLEDVRGATATATLFLYAFDKQNRVVDHLEQRMALDVAQSGDMVRTTGIHYYGTLRVPPGDYALKALVRVEESGRIGFARDDLRVPAFDSAVVLPPLLFAAPEKWLMLSGPARGDDFPYPFSTGEAKFVPLSRPELQSGGEYKLALFLYRVPVEGLALSPVVASADGAVTQTANVALVGRTAADERGGTKLLLSFRPDGLQPGHYELQLTVTPKEGSASMVRMPFVMR